MSTDLPSGLTRPGPQAWRRLAIDVVGVLVVSGVVGIVAGLVWNWVWTPPQGTADLDVNNTPQWFYDDFPTIEREFSATAMFVVVGLVGGLLLGALAAWLCRTSELVVLVAVAGGSVLAGYLAYRVGLAAGPANPRVLALVVDRGTELPGRLAMPGRSPFVAWPIGALLSLSMAYLWWGARDTAAHVDQQISLDKPHADPRPGAHVD